MCRSFDHEFGHDGCSTDASSVHYLRISDEASVVQSPIGRNDD